MEKERNSSEEETTTTNRAHEGVDLLLLDKNKPSIYNDRDKKLLPPPPPPEMPLPAPTHPHPPRSVGIDSTAPDPPSGQLTIFYSGTVCVFDGISPEKAQSIMLIAAAAAASSASHIPFPTAASDNNTMTGGVPSAAVLPPSPILTRSSSLKCTAAVVVSAPPQQFHPIDQNPTTLCKLQAEVPIARRHSLQRFLEKRRDRLVSKIPYSLPPTSTTIRAAEDDKVKSISGTTTEAAAGAAASPRQELLPFCMMV